MQKTAYEMRISDWSSDVCSSDLGAGLINPPPDPDRAPPSGRVAICRYGSPRRSFRRTGISASPHISCGCGARPRAGDRRCWCGAPSEPPPHRGRARSEEHTSELQSLMRISYAVFCLKKKKKTIKYKAEQVHLHETHT